MTKDDAVSKIHAIAKEAGLAVSIVDKLYLNAEDFCKDDSCKKYGCPKWHLTL